MNCVICSTASYSWITRQMHLVELELTLGASKFIPDFQISLFDFWSINSHQITSGYRESLNGIRAGNCMTLESRRQKNKNCIVDLIIQKRMCYTFQRTNIMVIALFVCILSINIYVYKDYTYCFWACVIARNVLNVFILYFSTYLVQIKAFLYDQYDRR
jgi:hypothetical protein